MERSNEPEKKFNVLKYTKRIVELWSDSGFKRWSQK